MSRCLPADWRLAESERVFHLVLDKIDDILKDFGLSEEPILIRMTGCPNGCARPYNADIAFVGRAPGKYALFVGGSVTGERLAGLQEKTVTLEDIPARVRGLIEEFVQNRHGNENFTNYWGRTHRERTSAEAGPIPLRVCSTREQKPGWRGGLIDRTSKSRYRG